MAEELLHNLDVLQRILSFLPLEELQETREVSPTFQNASDTDRRWIPVIAPPSLADEVLDIHKHGQRLRHLFFKSLRFRDWWEVNEEQDNVKALLRRKSHLDGFFSLAPWENSTSPYPNPWLHRMVYDQACPTETITSATEKPRKLNPIDRSCFFQQRVRIGGFRTFTSTIIDPYLIVEERIKRVVLQPVNVRHLSGEKHPKLPDHQPETLEGLQDACERLLECYFGEGNVKVNPVCEHRTKLEGRNKFCRYDQQKLEDENGRRVVQVNAAGLVGVCSDEALRNDTALVFLVAPHMYMKQDPTDRLCWCFSSPICRHRDIYRHTDPWAISSFQFYQHCDDIKEVHCQLASSVLYSTFMQLYLGGICENRNCTLNNSDSVEENDASTKLILCPSCIRKLNLAGIIKDVPSFLRRLSALLQQEPFASGCPQDLRALSEYGVVDSKLPGETARKRMKANEH